MVRVYVRGAARQNDAINVIQQRFQIRSGAQRRQNQGQSAADLAHGGHIAVADPVAGMVAFVAKVGHDNDDPGWVLVIAAGSIAIGCICLIPLHALSLTRRRLDGKAHHVTKLETRS